MTTCTRAAQVMRRRSGLRPGRRPRARAERSTDHLRPERRLPALLEKSTDLTPAEVAEPEVLERSSPAGELAAEERLKGEQEPRDTRRIDTAGAAGRFEERQAERDVFGHVSMLHGEDLAP